MRHLAITVERATSEGGEGGGGRHRQLARQSEANGLLICVQQMRTVELAQKVMSAICKYSGHP